MIIALASDHNGTILKNGLVNLFCERGYYCIDLGPYDDQLVDYVERAKQLAEIVSRGHADRGILVCGTGIGMSIVANKVAGVRAALVHNDLSAVKSREHNDANVLCLGSWVRSNEDNTLAAQLWLSGKFGEFRHVRRVEKIPHYRKGKVIFANGVFDIVHQGHIQMLQWARSLGDWLVVGINSDASARVLKGPQRPVNPEEDRRAVLSSMRFVDEVIVFDDVKATSLIEELKPDIMVKGGEWLAAEVRARDLIPRDVEIKIFPFVEGYSTTKVIERVRNDKIHVCDIFPDSAVGVCGK